MLENTCNENRTVTALSSLSNPFSTGGGGVDFERKVQAAFVLTLTVEGFSPLLNAPVTSLDFQAKRLGWNIDDLLVTSLVDEQECKLLCQIKHGVAFNASNIAFKEVIHAAWSDLNQPAFDKKHDKIALITGLSPKSDVLRFIYTQANASKDEEDFVQRINEQNYSSDDNRKKLEVIKQCLRDAKGEDVSTFELWEFCKVFAVLVFDLAYENSINEFLIQALILSNSKTNTAEVWEKLLNYTGQCNKTAAHVNLEKMPEQIKTFFKKETLTFMPPANLEAFSPDMLWAKLALLGGWDENNSYDKQLVEDFLCSDYSIIQRQIQEKSLSLPSIVTFDNGIWQIKKSSALIEKCVQFYFDDSIRLIFQLATSVFQEKDRRIQPDGSFSILTPSDGVFDHSVTLRDGMLHGIATLSNLHVSFPSCSDNLINHEARIFVRNLLYVADSSVWTSLDTALTTIAEIHPVEYLSVLENAIIHSPETIESLFPKSGSNAMFSRNSIFSILWSIERLAWDAKYFMSCIRILGELASLNYEKTNHANTPTRSIVNILLPWHPQTLVAIQKQKDAITSLRNESPTIAWKIIKRLLPNSTKSTIGTNRPKYIINNLPEELLVPSEQINEMYDYYSGLAIDLARHDISKLYDLVQHFKAMDNETACLFLQTVLDVSNSWNDEEKYPVWSNLSTYKMWILNNAEAPLDEKKIHLLDLAIDQTAPTDALYNYRLVFHPQYIDYDEDESPQTASKFQKRRILQQEIPQRIYDEYGIDSVVQFGRDVNNYHLIANYLGRTIATEELEVLIKACFENDLERDFVSSVLYGFCYSNDVSTVGELNLIGYPPEYIAWLLTCLPIVDAVFTLVDRLLSGCENLYWETISIPPYGIGVEADVNYVWKKLVEHKRPVAAINLFGIDTDNCDIPAIELEATLITASSTECAETLDPQAVCNLIAYLQNKAPEDINTISDIEIIYLPWLDDYSKVKPKALRYRLANEPQFFCELISLMYKRKSAESHDTPLSENVSKRLFEVFFRYCVVPGTDWDGNYHEDVFHSWIEHCKKWGSDQDRYEVVMHTIGNGLSYAKKDENGLIDEFIIKELNEVDNEEMRRGFSIGIYNQRGVTWIDPEGKPEYQLASQYNDLASKCEELGYSRFAETLRGIANSYIQEAEHHIKQHRRGQEE